MAVQSFQEAHAQLYSGQSNQPQLANPARGLTLFQQTHDALIQANQNKPQPTKVSTNPVKVQGAKQPQQQPQQSPLDVIRQSPIGGIAKTLISTIKNLPEAHFADKMNMYTPLGFVANLAQGLVNTPAEAFKGVVHLGETTKNHTATPQSAAGDIAAEVQLPLLFLTGPEAAPAKTAVQASAKTIIANLAKAGIKESAIGAGFGFLGGLQSGRDINNTTDYLKNLLQNIGIGAGTGLGIGTALHGAGAATKLVGKHVVIPLMQGASHTDGAVFVDHATTNPTIAHLQLPPEKAQAIVLGNEDLSKSSAGKAILKESIVAQDGSGHVAITPTEDGKYALPNGKKVDILAVPIYDPKTKYDTPDIVSARAEQAKIPSTDKITTPERQQFREDLAQKLYDNGGYAKLADRPLTEIKSNKRADIVTGLPGSGKNTIISEPLIRQHGSVLIDSDEAKKGIPESNGGAYSGATHGESTQVINSVMDKALGKGNNIVMPLVGRNIDKIRQIRDELNARGYEVHLHHNEVSLETSATRAVERYKRSGKFVDPDYIVNEVGLQPNKNYDILKQEKGFKSYEKYNNDVKPGEKPKLLESSSYEADHNGGKNAKSSERSSGTHRSVNSGTSETKQTEQSGLNTRKNSEQSPNQPVGTGKLKTSKVYEHTAERLLALDPERFKDFKDGQPYYNVAKASVQVEKAADFIEKDPQKAFSVAMGYTNPPEGLRANDVSIALSDRALTEKNDKLMAQLETSMSLRSTRQGQDIAALRGRGNDNSPHAFIQQVMSQRLNKLGKSSLTDAIDMTKRVVGKTGKQVSSVKERAVARIDMAAERLSKQLKKQQAKIQSAQSLLDQLTCK